MVFDAHERAFAFFWGACTRGIYDNTKTVARVPHQHVAVDPEDHRHPLFDSAGTSGLESGQLLL
jgi:hypothetical protein